MMKSKLVSWFRSSPLFHTGFASWCKSAAPVFTGTGRIGRASYLLGIVGVLLCNVSLSFAVQLSAGSVPGPLIGFSAILVIWSMITLTSRRAHDLGQPGWLMLFFLITWIFFVERLTASVGPAWMVVSFFPIICLATMAGDLQDNRFGRPARYKPIRVPLSLRLPEQEESAS